MQDFPVYFVPSIIYTSHRFKLIFINSIWCVMMDEIDGLGLIHTPPAVGDDLLSLAGQKGR